MRTITDDGVGIAHQNAGTDWSGLKLKDALAHKINGVIQTCGTKETSGTSCTKVTVTFPRQPPLPNVAAAA